MRSIFLFAMMLVPTGAICVKKKSLFTFVKQGNFNALKNTLSPYISNQQALKKRLLTQRDHTGKTLLHCSAKQKSPQITRFLIHLMCTHGIGLDAQDAQGKTALHYATTKPQVELLLQSGAQVDACDSQKDTPLHTYKSARAIATLIKADADVNARNINGDTPLHSHAHRPDQVQALLAANPCPTIVNMQGETPFDRAYSLAVSYHRTPRGILAKRAYTLIIQHYGLAQRFSLEHLSFLHAYVQNSVLLACFAGNTEQVKQLLEKNPGHDSDWIEEWGTSPLIVAAACGHKELVEYLLRLTTHTDLRPSLIAAIANRISNIRTSADEQENRTAIIRMLLLHQHHPLSFPGKKDPRSSILAYVPRSALR